MTFGESIKTCFSKYADFSGRASRSEYWWWFLFVVLVSAATGLISDKLTAVFSLAVPAAGDRRQRSPASRHRQERMVSVAQLHSGDRLGHLAVLGCARRAGAEPVLIHIALRVIGLLSSQSYDIKGTLRR